MTKNSVNALKLSPVTTILTDLLLAHLGLDDDVSVRGATPEVALLDLGGDALGADAVHAVRTSAVVVELLPVVVEHHGGLDVGLTVLETFVDHLEHAVPFLVRLQEENDFDLGSIRSLDGIQGDGNVRHGGNVPVMCFECLFLNHFLIQSVCEKLSDGKHPATLLKNLLTRGVISRSHSETK